MPEPAPQDGKIGTVKEVVLVKSIKDEFRYRYSQYMAAEDSVKKYNWLEGLVTMGIGYVKEENIEGDLKKKEIEGMLVSCTENDAKPRIASSCVGVELRVPIEMIEKDAYWQMLPFMRKLWIPIHRALIKQGYMSWEDVSDKEMAFKALKDMLGKKAEPIVKKDDVSDKIGDELEKI
jgi:hypothetical protein